MTCRRRPQSIPSTLLGACVLVLASSGWTCNVPVFRYALEFWPAAPYEAIVYHRGSLSPEEREVVTWLDSASAAKNPYSNFDLRQVDLDALKTPGLAPLPANNVKMPRLALFYPSEFQIQQPFWSGDLIRDNARALADSPARREIAKRLLEGHSAVWVLIESGEVEKDTSAREQLEERLRALEQTLRLPTEVIGNSFDPQLDSPAISTSLPLDIRFSLLTVSQADAAESIFIQMLLHSESDLSEFNSQPIAFPVYGRGRALYALVGNGITSENVREACEFLVGPCSCQAKALNPGIDLLIAADWDGGLGDDFAAISQLQPLIALSSLVQVSAEVQLAPSESSADPAMAASPSKLSSRVGIGILAALAILIAAAGLLSLAIAKRGRGGQV